ATEVIGSKLSKQRVLVLGAGSSAHGISDQILTTMIGEGLADAEARARIWQVDSQGLVLDDRANLEPAKAKYAQPREQLTGWKLDDTNRVSFAEVVRNLHPTVLIGTSAQPGAFTREIVLDMAEGCRERGERPVIFPLSNPTSKSEAVPIDLIDWTDGKALVATGSPFPAVVFDKKVVSIGQCNNAFIFP